jgi:hypothetical protein
MSKSRSEVIDRINKLRALAKSPNRNEAENAARLAEKLIVEHGMREAELVPIVGSNEHPDLADEPLLQWEKRPSNWARILAHGIAEAHNCATIEEAEGDEHAIRVVGMPDDVAIVAYMFAWLSLEVLRLAHEAADRRKRKKQSIAKKWRDVYALGLAEGMLEALEEGKREATIETASAHGLAVWDQRTIRAKDMLDELYPDSKESNITSSIGDERAYEAGMRAGKKVAPTRGEKGRLR